MDLISNNQEYKPFIPNEKVESIIPYHAIKNRVSDEGIRRIIRETICNKMIDVYQYGHSFNQYKRTFENKPVSLERFKELSNELDIKLEENK